MHKTEQLIGKNKYYCERCQKHTNAEIDHCVRTLPTILIIHIKRFEGTSKGIKKLCSPMDVLCQVFIHHNDDDCVTTFSYSLQASVVHSGTDAASGHYVA
ncbi:ubiquitin carboxyl-terminal hydrolase 46-like [Dysidea avara]|uniref:ubiquitin carboxyl-terminal hydrolase 46-like n=1 Tax=Dysidea avara TaxID=196820 RepID=UPI00331AEFC6